MEIQRSFMALTGLGLQAHHVRLSSKPSGVGETLAVHGAEREKSEENCFRLLLICAELELPVANWKGKRNTYLSDWCNIGSLEMGLSSL